MRNKMAAALITLMGLALLGYTASRTLHFVQMTLPPDSQDTAYLALVAFDGGLVLWSGFYLYGAKGAWQRGIAALMIVVSLVGVLIGFGADTMYTATSFGLAKMSAGEAQSAIIGMVIIIGLNVAAVTLSHMLHPDALRAQAEEEAEDQIHTATLDQIKANAKAIAPRIAQRLGAEWADRTDQHHASPAVQIEPPHNVSRSGAQKMSPLDHARAALSGNGNGHEPPNAP